MSVKKRGQNCRFDLKFMKIQKISEKHHNTDHRKDVCSLSLNVNRESKSDQSGFSLIEVTIAMVVFLIAVLGVFFSFTFAVSYNAGNSARAQALAVLQQKVETMRSAKFTPGLTDSTLTGGTKTPEIISSPDGNTFRIQVVVDDDPFTSGVQADTTKLLKEVTVTVTLNNPTPGWQTSIPATVVLRRVRGN